MPFTLRKEGDIENSSLACPYGSQITTAKLVYYTGSKSISILGDGGLHGLDGLDQLLYNGELLDASSYVFHAGTITTQIVPIDVTTILGETITLASNPYNITTQSEVALVAGVDPSPAPFPAGVKQHQKLYVVESAGNNIKLSLTAGGTALSWTSSAYLLTNLKVYRANAGYFDPIQGRPTYFPDVDFTFSGISYVEVNLSGDQASLEEEPTKFQMFVRGRRLQNYTSTGLFADEEGVAYPDQNNLPVRHAFFSANNALVAVDIMLEYMKISPSRIDWPSFVKFREHCKEIISWNSGVNDTFTHPNWTNVSPVFNGLDDAEENSIGSLRKTTGTTTWDAGAISYQTIPDNFTTFKMQAIYRGGHVSFGIARRATPINVWNEVKYGLHPSTFSGKVNVLDNFAVVGPASTVDANYGDKLRIEGTQTAITYYINEELVHTATPVYGTGDPLRACIAFNTPDAKLSDFKMSPIQGSGRSINRFDAHVVFPSEIDSNTALSQVMGRAPSCHWQDVDGKIKFIVGSTFVDLTTGGTPVAGDRVLVKYISYDPTQNQIKSNIVQDSFSYYKKPADEKQNFLRIEFRDIEDAVFLKKYSFQDRPQLRDYVNSLIDFGVVPMGVASQSLADRFAEATLRWNSDLDLFVNVKGTFDTFDIAKGDVVRFAHDVPGWTLQTAPTFIVIDETFEQNTADERTFTLQIYSDTFYSDTAHGAITPSLPSVTSRLVPPPVALDLLLTEENRILPDGTNYSTIVGTVVFDNAYGYSQRARIYWKRPSDVEFTPTSLVLEQPNINVGQIPFELNFANLGEHEVKVVTETLNGLVSTSSIVSTIEIEGTLQVNYVEWEGLVNTQLVGTNLVKTGGTGAWDAGARSIRSLHHGSGYVQWNIIAAGKTAVGLTQYGRVTIPQSNTNMLYGLIIETGQQPIPIVGGVNQTAVGTVTAVDFGYKIQIFAEENIVRFYQVISGVATQFYTTTWQNKYPLFVDSSIYTMSNLINQPQFYGKLENTKGIKLHWKNIQGLTFNQETITKLGADGWSPPLAASAFSIEYLTSDGALEFEATELDHYRLVGLSPIDANEVDPTVTANQGIKFAIFLKGSEFDPPTTDGVTVYEWYGGTYHQFTLGTYVLGDIFRIEREGTTIRYRQNGNLIYTSLEVSPKGEKLHADMGFYDQDSTVKNVRIKKVGVFTQIIHPYPIYEATNLIVEDARPEDDGNVYVQISGTFPTDDEAPILRANLRVFDKFGSIVKTFPTFTYAGNGVIGQGYHDRKYADPYSEAIYEVTVANDIATSQQAIYIQGNGATPTVFTTTLTKPALKNPTTSVLDLVAATVDHTSARLSWNYSGNVQMQYRIGLTGTWTTAVTGLSSPYTITGLVPSTYYEFRVSPTGTTANYSNISRTKTQDAPLTVDVAPPPLSLAGVLNAANPDTKVDLSWVRNSTTNTDVKIYKNGTFLANLGSASGTTYTALGLTASTTYTFKLKNVYAGGDSQFSNEISITTNAGVTTNVPSGLDSTPLSKSRIDLTWINNTAAGTINIDRSFDEVTWTYSGSRSASLSPTFSNIGLSPDSTYYYRISNSTTNGYSNTTVATTYVDIDSCVLPDTKVWALFNNQVTLIQAKHLNQGDSVLSVEFGGQISITKIKQVIYGYSDKLNVLTTEKGNVLKCTPSHPLITSKEMNIVHSYDVKTGDSVLVYDEVLDNVSLDVIQSKEILEGEFNVITFELESVEHTFITNGIVSHNVNQKF